MFISVLISAFELILSYHSPIKILMPPFSWQIRSVLKHKGLYLSQKICDFLGKVCESEEFLQGSGKIAICTLLISLQYFLQKLLKTWISYLKSIKLQGRFYYSNNLIDPHHQVLENFAAKNKLWIMGSTIELYNSQQLYGGLFKDCPSLILTTLFSKS